MRKFTEVMFWGGGDYSLKLKEALHQRLEEAISIAGGLQQPGHPDSEQAAREDEEEYEIMKNELLDAVKDINAALGIEINEP